MSEGKGNTQCCRRNSTVQSKMIVNELRFLKLFTLCADLQRYLIKQSPQANKISSNTKLSVHKLF
jgi:hypothetical protein